MEGSKRSITRSLSFRLTIIFCVLGLIGAITTSFWSYRTMLNEAQEFVDEELSQIAAIVINYDMLIPRRWEGPRHLHERVFARVQTPSGRSVIITTPRGMGRGLGMGRGRGAQDLQNENIPSLEDLTRHDFDIVIAPLIGRARDNLFLPLSIEDGFYNVIISDKRVRVFVGTKIDGQRFVVARPLSSAMHLSSRAFKTSLTQFLVVLGIYIPLVIVFVNLMFRSLNKSAKKIDKRPIDDLSAVEIDRKIPSEVDGFIQAINRLLQRIKDSVEMKRRFIADAAHEMRTPLTALSLQAENLLEEDLPPKAREKLIQLQKGIVREKELMTSLLNLARAQDENLIAQKQEINLKELFLNLIDDLSLIADEKDLDFGIDGPCDYQLVSDYHALKGILSNLVSNALKYTPACGQVDLKVEDTSHDLTIIVQDNGPGIDEEYLEHVFEPFYRVKGDTSEIEGTGLGLSIAKAQAQKLGAILTLENVIDDKGERHGLKASLRFAKSCDQA